MYIFLGIQCLMLQIKQLYWLKQVVRNKNSHPISNLWFL